MNKGRYIKPSFIIVLKAVDWMTAVNFIFIVLLPSLQKQAEKATNENWTQLKGSLFSHAVILLGFLSTDVLYPHKSVF